jgi:thiosulfate reductase cytochrome b subunit
MSGPSPDTPKPGAVDNVHSSRPALVTELAQRHADLRREQQVATSLHQRPPQPWAIRLTHWLNVPLLWILSGSGLQILTAFPSLGPRGRLYSWYPFQDAVPPDWLRIGEWLAGARHWHFAFAWFLVLNAAVYLGYVVTSGEWRRRLFIPKRDTASAISALLAYLRFKKVPPNGLYNGLQRLAYTGVVLLGILEVWSGLVLYKPVQLSWLALPLGGYDMARAIHLIGLFWIGLFLIGHVLMVLLHPGSLLEMITGGKRNAPK